MSLLKMIRDKITDTSSTDHNWRQYIEDHREYIQNKSKLVTVPAIDAFKNRYRPETLLEQYNINASTVWIILLLNQIDSVENFIDITELYIPDYSVISELKRSYDTYMFNVNNANNEL